ncbi:DUF3500 domain-containing protein [Pseudosporangium ferrugineum]|uniref:Uncharacterized protein DUF3500 n=1 Tax=Pseudosporangium ferrugineum TaxID=439699 RepID=A0A2T0SJR6_9ACTN|nr:uncharacterized protein DUF3500 [Pseudosporangium ferrugineum]
MTLAGEMAAVAAELLAGCPEAGAGFDDPQRHWIEYRPRPRPGVSLAGLAPGPRKIVHRLLATGLSPAAFAQAMAVLALEEVLDRREGGHRGRHSEDYRVIVFGTPGGDAWAWRFEGHHLSVSMTIAGRRVSPAPVFLGANPARVDALGRPVLRPLGAEEDLGRELLLSLSTGARRIAVVGDVAPYDIRTGTHPRSATIAPAGIARADLRPGERALLDQLVALYLGRLPDELAAQLDPAGGELHFAWEGPPQPGTRHYYRVQGPDLLIEFDNTTDDGNHAHTVLRRPHGEFGGDLLAAHHAGPSHTA